MVEIDNNNTHISIFLDLLKPFDTINHKILLDKLKYYGIDGLAHNLIESYLTNRKKFVEIDGFKSDILTVNTGVPQGSILGPLVFIIYVNDISKAFDTINHKILFNKLKYYSIDGLAHYIIESYLTNR